MSMVGIALEGGAVRCAFTSGVIDALIEHGFTADMAAGTSAGAGCILNFRAGQVGGSLQMTLLDKRHSCFGIRQLFRSGHFLNLKLMAETHKSCSDIDSYFKKSHMYTEYIAACCEDGMPGYLCDEESEERLFTAIKASCALPVVCTPVEVDGKHYVDGSIIDPIPFSHLLDLGCSKVIAVLTGPVGCHPTDYTPLKPLLYLLYHRKYPALYRALMQRIPCYWEQMQRLEEAEKNGQAYILRPQVRAISLFTRKEEQIRAYYQHGVNIVNQSWDKIFAWLAEEKEKTPALCGK